jgi:NAD(P)-dependent dehydrogenase (short-subunit alcohol dehydrogenase family)
MNRFENKTALITGAADGIGRATAQVIAAEGGTVVCADLNANALAAVVEAIGPSAHAAPANALDQADVKRVMTQVLSKHPRIDILVNCVGGSTIIDNPAAGIENLSLEEWQGVLDFNLTGTFLFTQSVVPVMKSQGSGKIINLSSIAGRGLSDVSSSSYATAKGGIIALTRKLSIELGPHGITCNAVAPGKTMSDRIKSRWERLSDEQKARALAGVPLQRFAEPEDQARVICFLASGDADMVTGVTIDVNGGMR